MKSLNNNNALSIEDISKDFLKQNIKKENYIVNSSVIPNRKVREYLIANNYLFSPIKGIYIIKDGKTPSSTVLEQNYFQLLSKLGGIISGDLALNYFLGENKKIEDIIIFNQDKNGEVILGDSLYKISYKKYISFKDIEKVDILGSKFNIESKLSFLINNFNEYKDNEKFKILLDSTTLNFTEIGELIKKGINQTSLSKLAFYYQEANNIRNYTIIKNELTKLGKGLQYGVKNGKTSKTKILTSDIWDKEDINPKLARFEMLLNKLNADCIRYFDGKDLDIFKSGDLSQILSNIDKNIAHDTYHSLTIENYKVKMEDIEILKNETENNKNYEDIQNKLIIKGYLNSFNFLKESIRYDFGHSINLEDKFIQKLNVLLFEELAKHKGFNLPYEYRKNQIQITGTSHIPPDYRLVGEYMNKYLEFINSIKVESTKDILRKAILGHFIFVFIHPFGDGNGRTARFLMNYILCTNGLNWITILSENKDEYIRTLKNASENENIIDFCNFIVGYSVKKTIIN